MGSEHNRFAIKIHPRSLEFSEAQLQRYKRS